MTSQVDIDLFFGDGGEALVCEAVSFVFGRDNWARSLVGANSGWNERSPPAGVVAEQWFFPFNPRMVNGVGGEAEVDEWTSCEFVRQDPSGVFNVCSCDVHCATGAAKLVEVGVDLVNWEPGFMAPLPRFVCVSLDWLYQGFLLRTKSDGSEIDVAHALMSMRFPSSRADRIRTSVVAPVVAPVVQPPSPVQAAQPVLDSTVDNMETSPSNFIRVGVLRTDSFGDEAGKVHRAALAHVYPSRSNTKKRHDVVLDKVVGTEIFEM